MKMLLIPIGLAIVCAACATVAPVPTERLAASQASLRGAQEAGADKEPQAKLHLKIAADELEQAQALMAQQKNEEAGRLLERSKADAELAVGIARQAHAEAEAQQAVAAAKAFQANP